MSDSNYQLLESGVIQALKTYSNVHRGAGFNSVVTSQLYEEARGMVLDYLDLPRSKYTVLFGSKRRIQKSTGHLRQKKYQVLSSKDIGLPLGVRALVIKKNDLPGGVPAESGGGTASLTGENWVIWAKGESKQEAGTPAIINIIAFARALQLIKDKNINRFTGAKFNSNPLVDILYANDLEGVTGQKLFDKLKGDFVQNEHPVPAVNSRLAFTNLDNSASTPALAPAWEAFRHALQVPEQRYPGLVAEVKEVCLEFLGANTDEYDVVFTSNTTESINLVADTYKDEKDHVIVTTYLEHSSNDLPWRLLPGAEVVRVNVDENGFVKLEELDKTLAGYNQERKFGSKRVRILTISGASNVLGTCNDLEKITRLAHRHGVKVMVDAAQLVAHQPVDLENTPVDYLAFSGHKIYAPFGCGVLIVKKGMPGFSGNFMKEMNASGEENVAGIVALGKVLHLLKKVGMKVVKTGEQEIVRYALENLKAVPGIKIHGITGTGQQDLDKRVGVIVFQLKKMMADSIAKKLSASAAIGVRYGCHCSHIMVKKILGVGPGLQRFQWLIITLFRWLQLPGITRVSLGMQNTREDIDKLVIALKDISTGNHVVSDRSKAAFKKELNQCYIQLQDQVFSKV